MKARGIPILLLPALLACGTAPEPAPAAPPAPGGQKAEARDDAAEAVKERLDSADVVFEGILKSSTMARRSRENGRLVVHGPSGTILAAVDPRFLIEVEVRKVRKGDEKEWNGTRFVAIHSLAESFSGDGADAGKSFVFHLWRSEGDAKRFVMLESLPLP